MSKQIYDWDRELESQEETEHRDNYRSALGIIFKFIVVLAFFATLTMLSYSK